MIYCEKWNICLMTSFGWTRKSGNFGVNSAFQEGNVRLQILEILCLSKWSKPAQSFHEFLNQSHCFIRQSPIIANEQGL